MGRVCTAASGASPLTEDDLTALMQMYHLKLPRVSGLAPASWTLTLNLTLTLTIQHLLLASVHVMGWLHSVCPLGAVPRTKTNIRGEAVGNQS
jgi:hypothetical protein